MAQRGHFFEGGTRVPLVIHGPNIAAGRNPSLVNTTDLHATIADIAGAQTTQATDGMTLAPLMDVELGSRQFAYVEHFGITESRPDWMIMGWAIRDQQHKLVAIDGQARMLFDLKNDPFEQNDLLSGDNKADMQSKADQLYEAYETLTKE